MVTAKHFQFGVNFSRPAATLFVFLDKIFAQFIEHLMHKSQPWSKNFLAGLVKIWKKNLMKHLWDKLRVINFKNKLKLYKC